MKTKKGFRLFCIITFTIGWVILNVLCGWICVTLKEEDLVKIKALFIMANVFWVLMGGGLTFLTYNACKQFYK